MKLVVFLLLAAGLWYGWSHYRRQRRRRLQAQPFPAEWQAILQRNVKVYRLLPEDLKQQLHGHIQVFLDEKRFFACEGMALTDEMRITVAGQACLLLLNRKSRYFPGFKTILLYPASYVAVESDYDGDIASTQISTRAGESWQRGPIVLSWADVLHGGDNHFDGSNVVLHEFAHKLDEETGSCNGLPVLHAAVQRRAWADVLGREFSRLKKQVRRCQRSVIDDYGATNPAEFFAVVTETFFEKPALLYKRHPELYAVFRDFYQLDPGEWHSIKLPPSDSADAN